MAQDLKPPVLGGSPVAYKGGFVHRKNPNAFRIYVPACNARSGHAHDCDSKLGATTDVDAKFRECLGKIDTLCK